MFSYNLWQGSLSKFYTVHYFRREIRMLKSGSLVYCKLESNSHCARYLDNTRIFCVILIFYSCCKCYYNFDNTVRYGMTHICVNILLFTFDEKYSTLYGSSTLVAL
jgi:hypothetical protein